MAPRPRPAENREERAAKLDDLLRSRGELLRHQARRHSVIEADADDALADACISFLRFYEGDDGRDALRFMLTVVKHAAWGIARRRRTGEERELEAARTHGALPQVDAIATEGLDGHLAERDALRDLLSRIGPEERAALLLSALGYSHHEIGELYGWTPRMVRRRITAGRTRLLALIDPAVDETEGAR
jgi:RNA polymerase sigma factor (sigma-70 family)